MFLKSALSIVGAAVAAFLVAAPVQAATVFVFPSSSTNVTAGNTYQANMIHTVSDGTFTDTYTFNFGAGLGASLNPVYDIGTPFSSFTNLTYAWSGGQNGNILPGSQNLGNLTVNNILGGIYTLIISGSTAGASSYQVNLNVFDNAPVPTPLPGALALLATVLFGGFGFSKLRQRFA